LKDLKFNLLTIEIALKIEHVHLKGIAAARPSKGGSNAKIRYRALSGGTVGQAHATHVDAARQQAIIVHGEIGGPETEHSAAIGTRNNRPRKAVGPAQDGAGPLQLPSFQ